MIELAAYSQVYDKQVTLDLQNEGAISLNYEVGKVGDVVGRYAPFSQTFTLPFTNTNNKFFRQFYNINNESHKVLTQGESSFKPDYNTDCQIRVEGVPIITGTMQMTRCNVKERTYEVVVYGAEAGLFRALDDKKLIDAFRTGVNNDGSLTPDYNVNINDENIVDSWDNGNDVTNGNVGDGIVIFPLIDYGYVGDYNFLWAEENGFQSTGLFNENFLMPYQLKPAINIRHLFELICNKAGYTLTPNSFLTSGTWDKLYMTLGSDRESLATTTIHQSVVGNTASATIANWGMVAGTNGVWQEILFPTQSGTATLPPIFYDTQDDWNAAGSFVAPYNGIFSGVFVATFDSQPASVSEGASVRVMATNGYQSSWYSPVSDAVGGDGSGDAILTTIEMPFGISLLAGEEITFQAIASCEAGYSVNLIASNTYVKILASSTVAGVADIPGNMPDISQTEFMTDLIERFNLAIVADEGDNKKLFVMPWLDYIQAGERKDWTYKLDQSKKRSILPTTNFKKRTINFSDAEDEDNRNVGYQETYGQVFGTYTQELKGDYIKGELKNSPVFAPFHVNRIPRQDNTNVTDLPGVVIHESYQHGTEGPLSSCKPKLFYYNGEQSIGDSLPPIYIGEQYSYTYPLCLPYLSTALSGGTTLMASDSPLLYWQFQTPATWGGAIMGSTPSNEGYFKKYWQQFLADIYDSNARVLECSLYLTPGDIFNFKFNDEIVIEDTAYRVQKISGYQPFAKTSTNVTLIKKIFALSSLQITDTEADCEATPNAFYDDGTVTFWDYVTDSQVVSEICCLEYGYFWDGEDCYWDYGGGGGGSGDPTTGLGGAGNPTDTFPNDPVGGKADLKGVGGFMTRKSGGVPNINPVTGEHGTRGQNIESFANTVSKNFVYYATSKSDTAQIATANGLSSEVSQLWIPFDTMARFTIRALSVQTAVLDGGSGSYGSSSYNVWTALVKNIAGTITIVGISEQTDFRERDGDAGTRTIDIVGQAGKTGFAGNRGVNITCTGPADSFCAWHLDVEATYMDISYTKYLDDLILTEDLAYIITESGSFLEQE